MVWLGWIWKENRLFIDDIGCDNEGGDDYDFSESKASMHGEGISRQDTTSSISKIKQSETKKSRVGEAIAASISEIAVAFGHEMEQMTKKRQRTMNNQELMIELKRVEDLHPMIILEQLNILLNTLILHQCS
ncbi:hypothetical protein AMTR_s00004p00270770 [Amborella trichopoda]|uniref:Uncharacterized protein n=1 Tax=Amborella trichopoda TaxID=13333 RepID=W1NEI4_AMBTC|nr:hypothetical protein AMTR_s00004p00270770 [Amborella trichopoda]